MKTNRLFLTSLALMFLCYGCSNTDDKLRSYIEKHCDFKSKDTCDINIKDALNVDFDTMYVFGEYTQMEEFNSILRLPYKNTKLVEDSHYRIILLKNREIVYEDDFEQYYSKISRGENVKRVADENMTCYCRMYVSPIFKVEKVDNDNGQLTKYFYILKNVQLDGTILPRDTTGVGGY